MHNRGRCWTAIGRTLGISRERMRQIERRGLRRLRRMALGRHLWA
ncbi:MAG: sigma factor-like helix-turn-helix DNA-binding protein [Anaerolineae bacterium]